MRGLFAFRALGERFLERVTCFVVVRVSACNRGLRTLRHINAEVQDDQATSVFGSFGGSCQRCAGGDLVSLLQNGSIHNGTGGDFSDYILMNHNQRLEISPASAQWPELFRLSGAQDLRLINGNRLRMPDTKTGYVVIEKAERAFFFFDGEQAPDPSKPLDAQKGFCASYTYSD